VKPVLGASGGFSGTGLAGGRWSGGKCSTPEYRATLVAQ
jgi:hypothetical protein